MPNNTSRTTQNRQHQYRLKVHGGKWPIDLHKASWRSPDKCNKQHYPSEAMPAVAAVLHGPVPATSPLRRPGGGQHTTLGRVGETWGQRSVCAEWKRACGFLWVLMGGLVERDWHQHAGNLQNKWGHYRLSYFTFFFVLNKTKTA